MASDFEQDQSGSDPLPYTQVDRAVKQTAAMIATRLGVTFQHALGGLVQFWELNGDPRELEELLEQGRDEVVLDGNELRRRFSLAMSTKCDTLDADDLHSLRIVERREDGYRIRGMSRYFKPLRDRVAKRLAGRLGGQKSVETRKKKYGSAVPANAPNSSASASAAASEPTPNQPAKDFGPASSSAQAPPNTADSVQRSAYISKSSPADGSADGFWVWANERRRAHGHVAEHPPRDLSGWWSGVLMELGGDLDRVQRAFDRFLVDPHWKAQGCPFAAFRKQWSKYASEHYGKAQPVKGAAPESDWSSYQPGDTLKGLGGGT